MVEHLTPPCAVGNPAASQLQGPQVRPRALVTVRAGFNPGSLVFFYLPKNTQVGGLVARLEWYPVRGAFLPLSQCSSRSPLDEPDQNKVVSEDE